MPSRNPGPAPVARSTAVAPAGQPSALARNYQTIVDTLKADKGADVKQIRELLGSKEAMDRFLAVCFASLSGDSDLVLNADPLSIVQSIKDAASLGLEPTGLTGEGAIIRYGKTAKFMPMWRGYLKRIRNSGKVLDVDAQVVYENDEFEVKLGTNPSITHVPVLYDQAESENNPRGGFKGFYAWALMPSGTYIIEYLSVDDINAIRDRYAQSYKDPNQRDRSPWVTAYSEQARKTVIRRLSKRLPGEAVDKLLLLDAQADEAAGTAKEASRQADAAVSEVRRLALAAVGQAPQEPSSGLESPETPAGDAQGPAQPDAAGASETAKEPSSDAGPAGTAEPSQPSAEHLEACDSESPYDKGDFCSKVKGHPGNHQAGSGTWS